MTMTKIFIPVLVGALLLGAPACTDLTSPNFNFGDLDDLVNNPTPASVNTAAIGVLLGNRTYYPGPNDFVSMLGILGRESYNNDGADPRFETEMLGSPLNAGSPAFGGNFWQEPYENFRLGQITLGGVAQLSDADYPPSAKEWTRGFVKTINALDFLLIVNTRDTNCGCPIELPELVDEPAPQVSKEQVFAQIVRLLDEGAAHLQAASGAAPFALPSGFDGIPGTGLAFFNDAENLRTFNRGIRARVAVYMGDYSTALQALTASFLDTSAPLEFGVYHVFSQGSGDLLNLLFDPGSNRLKLHPSIKADVELKADGTPDDRFTSKVRVLANVPFASPPICAGVPESTPQWPPDTRFKDIIPSQSWADQACDVGFTIYNSITAPIPIMRNEELILLRAEANIGLGNLAAAENDINLVRVNSGGLEPVVLTAANALDRLLYEKQFSLLMEGGHRWIDLRRYGLLGTLPLDKPGHIHNARYPIPLDETNARGN
jgi:hypothetical protein